MTSEPAAPAPSMGESARLRSTDIWIRGKKSKAPCARIQGRTIVLTGKWIKTAVVQDEQCLEGDIIANPEQFVAELKQSPLKADLFTFGQKPTQPKPQYGFHLEWDNAAMMPISDYAHWWDNLSQDTRRNVRKAAKQGVEVKVVPFDDELVRGIVEIYNETPMRQGREFWHYGKSFDVVKMETGTYPERSEYIGAYLGKSLIGFAKILYVDKSATIMFILSMEKYTEMRPTNALIAKAVEVSAERGCTSFQYRKYVYGGNEASSLTEFKRRNGFEHVRYPRYYIPLSMTGKAVLKFNLHHGVIPLLPKKLSLALRGLRKWVIELKSRRTSAVAKSG